MYKIVITKIDKDVPFRDKEWQSNTHKNEDGDWEGGYEYFDTVHDVTTQVYEQTINADAGLVNEVVKTVIDYRSTETGSSEN